jgi:transcriptional regulator with XRE-family HTH domain
MFIEQPHPLKVLREKSGLTLIEVSKRVHISPSRISLMENFLASLTPKEEKSIRETIVELTKDRSSAVLRSADPRFVLGLKTIKASPTKARLFEKLVESRKYSELEAVIITLGKAY